MPSIRPSSDLRNKYNEISEFCHTYQEPVFITKNGTGDLVVMSNTEYERLCGDLSLRKALNDGLTALLQGDVRSTEAVFSEFEQKFDLREARFE